MNDTLNFASKINGFVDQEKDKILDFLMELIAIESVTSNEGNATKYLSKKMKEFDFDEVRIDKVGNVLGRIGSGKTVILFDAHIDTVELGDESEWGFNPIKPQIRDGYIHGRGVVDDKGCLAGIVYAGKAIKALGLDKDFTLWISGSVSEESATGYGAYAMLLESPDIKPDYILVAEASEGRIIRGHKGKALLKIKVPGKCAHASAAWRGENALIKALPIIEGIDKLNNFKEDAFLGKGTIEVTNVECKTPSLNTIPGEVTIISDCRISSGESMEDILDEIKPLINNINGVKAEITTEKLNTYTGYEFTRVDYYPSWVIPVEHKIVTSGIEAYRVILNREPVVGRWDFCTNATFLCGKFGIPSLGFGPGDGTLCHSNEERLSIKELLEAIRFYSVFPLIISK